jgi:hypothetical protein
MTCGAKQMDSSWWPLRLLGGKEPLGELGDDEERIIGIFCDANVMVRAGAVDDGCNCIGSGSFTLTFWSWNGCVFLFELAWMTLVVAVEEECFARRGSS